MSTFYRNTGTIYMNNGDVIDKHSLWELKGDNLLVLVDDDRYIEHDIGMNFEKVIE